MGQGQSRPSPAPRERTRPGFARGGGDGDNPDHHFHRPDSRADGEWTVGERRTDSVRTPVLGQRHGLHVAGQ